MEGLLGDLKVDELGDDFKVGEQKDLFVIKRFIKLAENSAMSFPSKPTFRAMTHFFSLSKCLQNFVIFFFSKLLKFHHMISPEIKTCISNEQH